MSFTKVLETRVTDAMFKEHMMNIEKCRSLFEDFWFRTCEKLINKKLIQFGTLFGYIIDGVVPLLKDNPVVEKELAKTIRMHYIAKTLKPEQLESVFVISPKMLPYMQQVKQGAIESYKWLHNKLNKEEDEELRPAYKIAEERYRIKCASL